MQIERSSSPGEHTVLRPVDWRGFTVLGCVASILVFATRLPFASEMLFSWDAANYALALARYNVEFHQPHPPGNPLYVASAWLIDRVVADANRSYVLLNILASAGATIAILGLTWRLQGRHTAILASLLFLTSPMVWSHGEIAYPYIFLALFAALVGWCAAETRWGSRNLTVVSAALLGIGAGFRPDLLFWLVPTWVFGSWRHPRSMIVGLVLIAGLILAWGIPMVELSGGWPLYLTVLQRYEQYWAAPSIGDAAFLRAARQSARIVLDHLSYSLGPALWLVGLALPGRTLVRPIRLGPVTLLVAVMVLPAALFFTFVHIGNPGYVLAIMPPLVLAVATITQLATARLVEAVGPLGVLRWNPQALATIIVASIALVNGAIFLFAPGEGGRQHIQANDFLLKHTVEYVRAQHGPEHTVLIAGDSFRQLQYYFPEYYWGRRLLLSWDGASELNERHRLDIPRGVTTAIVVDIEPNLVRKAPEIREVTFGPGAYVFDVRVTDVRTLVYGASHLSIAR